MSALAFRSRKGRRRAELSVTPLIDVLFLLIIFFTLTSTFRRVGELELRLPDAATAVIPVQEDAPHLVELIATEEGRLFVDGEPFKITDLRERLYDIAHDDPETHVMIKAEIGVPHGDVVQLLDIVRKVGFPGAAIGTYVAATPLTSQ